MKWMLDNNWHATGAVIGKHFCNLDIDFTIQKFFTVIEQLKLSFKDFSIILGVAKLF